MEEGEEAEGEGHFEVFGVHRLQLAPGRKSGYTGVRRTASGKWQPWIHLKGQKRRTLGSFEKEREAAVARAVALACGPETLPSPRKQTPRNPGAAACCLRPFPIPSHQFVMLNQSCVLDSHCAQQ